MLDFKVGDEIYVIWRIYRSGPNERPRDAKVFGTIESIDGAFIQVRLINPLGGVQHRIYRAHELNRATS